MSARRYAPAPSRRQRRQGRRACTVPLLCGFCLLVLAVTCWVCALYWPAAGESLRALGLGLSSRLGRLWRWMPLPLSEVLLLALPLLAVALLVWDGVRGGWVRLRRGLCRLLCACCALAFLFVLLCGAQYTAPPLATRLGLRAEGATAAQLRAEAERQAAVLNELAELVPRDGEGACDFGSFAGLSAAVMQAWQARVDELPALSSPAVAAPRGSCLLGVAMSYVGNAGYFFPWTGESVVSLDCIDVTLPFSAAHESGHTRGVGEEAACNFLAWLVCSGSEDVRLRYSAAFMGYLYVGNALYGADRAAWQEVRDSLNARTLADLAQQSAHVAQYAGPVRELGNAVNDRFITATGQPDGLRSYGLMVDLLIAWNTRGEGQ